MTDKSAAAVQPLQQMGTRVMPAFWVVLAIAVCSAALALCFGLFPLTAVAFMALVCYVVASKVYATRFVVLVAVLTGVAFLLRRIDIRFSITAPGTEFRLTFFIVAAGCLVLFARSVVRRSLKIDVRLFLPFIALVATSMMSVAVGSLSELGRAGAIGQLGEMVKFLVPVTLCFVIAWGGLASADIRRIVRFIVLVAVATSLMVAVVSIFADWFVEFFGWKSMGMWYGNESIARARVPLSSGIHSGAFLVMVLPLCVQMYYASRLRRDSLFFLFSAAVIAVGIVFCFSRAILAAGVLTAVGMFLAHTERVGRLSRRGRKWVLVLLLIAALAALLSTINFERLIVRGKHSRSIEYRLKALKVALHVIKDHPIVGSSFATIYSRQITGFVPDARVGEGRLALIFYEGEPSLVNPHNLFLMIAAELGLVGFAVFLWLIYSIYRRLRDYASSTRASPSGRLIASGFLWGIFAFLLQSLWSSFLLVDVRVATLFWAFVGISLAYTGLSSDETQEADTRIEVSE